MKFKLIFGIFICVLYFYQISFAHGWRAPDEASKIKNPIPSTETSQSKGKEIYLDNCAYCHAENALGLSKDYTSLPMDTPNLIIRLKNHTEGDFFWKIQNGRGRMPSFKEDLSDQDIWDIINFINSLL